MRSAPEAEPTDRAESGFGDGAGSWGDEDRRARFTPPSWATIALDCLLVILAAVGSAFFFATRGDTVYGARADIVYVPHPGDPRDARERALSTQSELLRSRAVLAPVARETAVPLADLESSVSVDIGVHNDLLHLTVANGNRETARQLAEAVARRYLAVAPRFSPGVGRAPAALEREIARLSARARTAPGADRALLRDRIRRLQERIVDLNTEAATEPRMRLLSRPYVLPEPLSPKPVRAAALGLLLGLGLAAGVAVLRVQLARRRTGMPARSTIP